MLYSPAISLYYIRYFLFKYIWLGVCVVGLDFVGLGSMLKYGFGDEFETEADEVDVVVDFVGVEKCGIMPLFCWVWEKLECRVF